MARVNAYVERKLIAGDCVEAWLIHSVGDDYAPKLSCHNFVTGMREDVGPNAMQLPEGCSIKLTHEQAFALAKSLNEYFARRGSKPPNDETYLKGKLESTEAHLKDMRRIVFKKGSKNG